MVTVQGIPTRIDTSERYPPLLVPMQIVVDGTTLTGNCDLDLAWKWAAHEFGSEWGAMNATERSHQVGHALHELRRSAHAAGPIDVEDPDVILPPPSTST